MSKVEVNFKNYAKVEDADEILCYCIREVICSGCDTDDRIRTYFMGTGTTAYKKKEVRECYPRKNLPFEGKDIGSQRLSLSSFI